MSYTYTYAISQDFPDGLCNPVKLEQQINAVGSGINTQVISISKIGDTCSIIFKEQLDPFEKAALDGNQTDPAGGLIAQHDGSPSPPAADLVQLAVNDGSAEPKKVLVDSENRLIAATEAASGAEATKATHNFCDPCTWFQNSVRETEISLTDSGDGLTWNIPGVGNVIDLYHGRVLDESTWRNPQWCPQAPSHMYETIVEVSTDGGSTWVPKTMQDPNTTLDGTGQDGDFVVDYENGDVIFHTSQAGNLVRASFSRASTDQYASVWKLYPNPGYTISILFAEMQFSLDVGMADTLFQRVVLDYPGVGWIDVVSPARYMRLSQAIGEAATNTASIPSIDETSPRGVGGYQQFQFKYSRRKEFKSSDGVQLWIGLDRDKQLSGREMSITFHFVVDEE